MKTCLIIDDSSVVRKVARRILEDLDFTITEAEDGLEAFEKCRSDMPDVVMVDWSMPIMDGLEFVKRLRSYIGGDQPKVVYCTTENDVGKIAMAMNAGADDYVMKPFDREILEGKFAVFA